MSPETIGDVIKEMHAVTWPSPAERYWASRLEEAARTAPERIDERPRIPFHETDGTRELCDMDWLYALRVELGLEDAS